MLLLVLLAKESCSSAQSQTNFQKIGGRKEFFIRHGLCGGFAFLCSVRPGLFPTVLWATTTLSSFFPVIALAALRSHVLLPMSCYGVGRRALDTMSARGPARAGSDNYGDEVFCCGPSLPGECAYSLGKG